MLIATLQRLCHVAAAVAADAQRLAAAAQRQLATLAADAPPAAGSAAPAIAPTRLGGGAAVAPEGPASQLGLTAPDIRAEAVACLEKKGRWTASADLALAVLHRRRLPDDPDSRKMFIDACTSIFSRAARKRKRPELAQRKPDGKDAEYGLPGWDEDGPPGAVPATGPAGGGSAAEPGRAGGAARDGGGPGAARRAPPRRR